MKTLVVEDDFTSRVLIQEMLKNRGTVHVAVNGNEAVSAVKLAIKENDPYDLICLDIMMPGLDGQAALKEIRDVEEKAGIMGSDRAKVVMITALGDKDNIMQAFREQCDGYVIKPVEKSNLMNELEKLSLI